MSVVDTAGSNRVDLSHFIQNGPVRQKSDGVYDRVVKRVFDIAIVLLLAPVALVIVGVFCPLIMLDGKSPFYTQPRVGRSGRLFRMWKLRSMVADADARLGAYLDANPERRREWDENQKLRDDPRITRVGRIIRKTSIDELPQLWNVLRGEMSMVGPRPMMPDQQAIYPGTAYYALRPGITGFWQTSVRNESSFADRARFDAQYFRDLSLGTDLMVMLRTVRVVLCGTGC
ncbi:exopolysaccharide production protein ExoY [Roseovarius sp. MBR-79]|jgi:lipopolysaccharide/colanic/teichoic acid biosynthesis glycosyltransferase